MKYYKITSRRIPLSLEYQFAAEDNITKSELKKWFKQAYRPCYFVRVKEVDRLDVDILWTMYLQTEDSVIKFR